MEIALPTNGSLLGDGLRGSIRAMMRVGKIAGEEGAKLRDRSPGVRRRAFGLTQGSGQLGLWQRALALQIVSSYTVLGLLAGACGWLVPSSHDRFSPESSPEVRTTGSFGVF